MEKTEERSVKESVIDFEQGLNSEEARKRIHQYGYNEVPEKKGSPRIPVIKKLWGLTPWIAEITISLNIVCADKAGTITM